MIQRAMDGPEFSIDCLSDLDGRCLNAIPRTMIESRGGESIKGTVIDDRELVELGAARGRGARLPRPCTVQVFRDEEIGIGITDVNTRFGGAFPAPMYAALPGRTYPELIVRMARGERIEPHVGEFRAGLTFTRYYWQLELDARAASRPGATSSSRPVRRARAEAVLGRSSAYPPKSPQGSVQIRADQRQVGLAEPVARGLGLVPVRVQQSRPADLLEPRALLVGELELDRRRGCRRAARRSARRPRSS